MERPEQDNEYSDSLESSEHHHPIKERRKPQRFTVVSLAGVHSDDGLRAQQVLLGDEKYEWKITMRNELETLDKME